MHESVLGYGRAWRSMLGRGGGVRREVGKGMGGVGEGKER